ncbi:hypothetical protein [Mesorhizobium prunaredense]|uniref:hypothetical protein n=1 Tax=Mesorhizobium prunaredense TaxID=1631249 RepID=UPI001180B3EA|nr:hypothetical protein [Mesorhizobium prunaredense]
MTSRGIAARQSGPEADWLAGRRYYPRVSRAASVGLALSLWPSADPEVVEHDHDDLPIDHPHLVQAHGRRHSHPFVIDDTHSVWPTRN